MSKICLKLSLGGFPRDHLGRYFYDPGFLTKNRHVIFSEPFDIYELQDPRQLWLNMLIQNIRAQRK